MTEERIKEIADNADMITRGYAAGKQAQSGYQCTIRNAERSAEPHQRYVEYRPLGNRRLPGQRGRPGRH